MFRFFNPKKPDIKNVKGVHDYEDYLDKLEKYEQQHRVAKKAKKLAPKLLIGAFLLTSTLVLVVYLLSVVAFN